MHNNKENQEEEEAPSELPSVASPRISSVGASEGPGGSSRQAEQFMHEPQAYEMTSGHDHLHWGGVGRHMGQQPHDTRSIASSAATRDDKSIYEEPGALDATEEVVEHGDHDENDDEEDEEPEEITPTQVQGELCGVQLRSESSNMGRSFAGISSGGTLAEVVDQLADQAVAGELSPRQAAAAIRSATHDAAGSSGTNATIIAPAGSSAGGLLDGLVMDGSDSVSVSGAAHSSIAPSEDNWQTGGGGGAGSSIADPLEMVPLESTAELLAAVAAADEEMAGAASVAVLVEEREDEDQVKEAAAAQQQQTKAAARADAPEPAAAPEPEAATVAATVTPAPAAADSTPATEPEAAAAAPAASEPHAPAAPKEAEEQGSGSLPTLNGTAVAAISAAVSPHYHSRFMQQLSTAASEEDITVYITDSAGAPSEAVQLTPPPVPPSQQQQPQQLQQQKSTPTSKPAGGMHPLSIAGGDKGTADASAALAAINAVGSSAAAVQLFEAEAPPQPGLLFPPSWYKTFKGLLYMDGVDALGRPVVVLNADAVPANMKASALIYVKAHLEPLVNQGDYVLVFTSHGVAKLPSMWIMGAYRSLPRPFRKHVQYIVLVRPSAFLRTVLAFMRPFVSKKAGRKIKQVQSVHEIAEATGGEVTLQSLGPAFAAEQLAGMVLRM